VSPNKPTCPTVTGGAIDFSDYYFKKGVIVEGRKDNADAYRCLGCNTICEICADVCPNRANVMVEDKNGVHQIVHIDRMCNECGNCAVFCPHAGKPYRDKFTVFSSEEDFNDSDNAGFVKTDADKFKLRLEDKSTVDYRRGAAGIPQQYAGMIELIVNKYPYLLAGTETLLEAAK
jgi:putative selenate reductase